MSNPKAAPPTQMRELLAQSRRAGVPFERAWDVAWAQVRWPHDTEHRRDWKDRLEIDRRFWEEAYDRSAPPRSALRAVYSLLVAAEPEDERLVA